MQQQIEESELIARALDGDTLAYGELVDRYKNAVFHHCFAIVRDEDITQEAFISAYYSLKRYNNAYRLSTWLFKISTNKCLTYLKKKSREVTKSSDTFDRLATKQPGPATKAIHAELRQAVDRLKPRYRAVISLYYWQGLDYSEVAQVMQSPINSVRVWLKRAKEQLRKELL